MARHAVNVAKEDFNRLSLLLYGESNVGKTRLAGDAIAWCLEKGGKAKFVNTRGEDGYMSLRAYDIPAKVIETVDGLPDITDVCKEGPYDVFCLDSMTVISRWSVDTITGGKRPPIMNKEVNEWSQVHYLFEQVVRNQILTAAPFIVATGHARRHENAVTGELRISPDMEGRQSEMVARFFDMVAYMTATTNESGTVARRFIVKPMAQGDKKHPGCVTRQRLPQTISKDIMLLEGNGSYTKIIDIIKRHM